MKHETAEMSVVGFPQSFIKHFSGKTWAQIISPFNEKFFSQKKTLLPKKILFGSKELSTLGTQGENFWVQKLICMILKTCMSLIKPLFQDSLGFCF